jgi:hypothetical protein
MVLGTGQTNHTQTSDKDREAMMNLKRYIVLAYKQDDFKDLLKEYHNVKGTIDKMDHESIEAEFGLRFADLVAEN